jgi:hypothetical protein
MKFTTLAILALLTGGAAIETAVPARAEVQYPWCAEYSRRVGGTNCGFVNYQQCRETVSGIGGYCYRNPAYPPPQERRSPRR